MIFTNKTANFEIILEYLTHQIGKTTNLVGFCIIKIIGKYNKTHLTDYCHILNFIDGFDLPLL